ncbi:MAG: STAS domain-containing protein [Spirochaetales bacterium]|nr:STAS domain-containing protein [Leptospiraceae bacterium]MCP5481611.1 STAS domain-containing protein [Spirochaetales bacterium]MCP5484439.1 STAS domain-containing protein [Spirochaetales bacterium]
MKIESEEQQGTVVFRIEGRMDLSHVPLIDDHVRRYLEKGLRYFILNMVDVRDISSSGIGKILQLSRQLDDRGGRLVLADLSPVCEYVLDLAQLSDVIPTYKTEAEAVNALRKTS